MFNMSHPYTGLDPDRVSVRPHPIRVAVVDDYSVVRVGLQSLLEQETDMQLIASSNCGERALDLIKEYPIDVLILDIAMPGKGAIDVLESISSIAPHVGTVIFSAYPERQFALPMIRLGARSYVDKASAPSELVRAVRAVAGGHTYFSDAVRSLMAESAERGVGSGAADLTPREFQIFLRLASGETVTQIAAALSLSEVTVSSHRARLLKKLNLTSNSHLTRYAIQNHFMN